MTAYTLNLRVFWALAACLLTSLLLLLSSTLSRPESGEHGCLDYSVAIASFAKLAFLLALFVLLFLVCCPSYPGAPPVAPEAPARAGAGTGVGVGPIGPPRRELLEDLYERHVRLSPHVLGHSKAHVAKLVGELVRAGRPEVLPESSLALRGDFIQIGSSYEEHKVGRPDCFDILVPIRLPQRLKLEARGGRLETAHRSEWVRRHRVFADTFLCPSTEQGACGLAPDAVLRWFYAAVQRCLSAVRYPFERRCSLGLSLSEDRVLLRLTPRSDYVCCHISMVARLIPALPAGDGTYWVAAPRHSAPLWTAYLPRQEQKLLDWFKGRLPLGSCHLKCLQIAKAVRDLGGQALGGQAGAQWRAVLSSYSLKTAWFRLLLATPPDAWEERHLLDRLEDLLRRVRDGLQSRSLSHLFLGGDTGLLPDFLAVPRPVKCSSPMDLWAGFSPGALDLVSARLAYSWTHLHRLIRLGRPQRLSQGGGFPCKHADSE